MGNGLPLHRIAVNGYGRIGRAFVRAVYELGFRERFRIAAINDIAGTGAMEHLTRYDSMHGRFRFDVFMNGDFLNIDDDNIIITHEPEAGRLPWKDLGIDLVIESTGLCASRAEAEAHLLAGAGKVLLSYPGPADVDITVVYGVNHQQISSSKKIVSNASCTSNCLVPVLKVIDDSLRIKSGLITTIHSAMNDQPVLDTYNTDPRKMRSALNSIVPVKTHLAEGIARIMPDFTGRFETIAIRVPTTDVSAMDITLMVERDTDKGRVNRIIKEASEGPFRGIIGFSEEALVSCDFRQDTHSVVLDAASTSVKGNLIKLFCWFDNEWAYAVRLCDTALAMLG